MIEVKIRTITSEPDRRYRVLVLLQRSDRPRYWTFHCPQCTMPVGEIVNADVIALSDIIDMNNIRTIGAGTRCDGRFLGDKCRTWFYFSLGGGK